MTIESLLDFAKKNNLPLTTEIKIADIEDKDIDHYYIFNNHISLETYD